MPENNIMLTLSKFLAIVAKIGFVKGTGDIQLISHTLLISGMIVKQRIFLLDNNYIGAEVFALVG